MLMPQLRQPQDSCRLDLFIVGQTMDSTSWPPAAFPSSLNTLLMLLTHTQWSSTQSCRQRTTCIIHFCTQACFYSRVHMCRSTHTHHGLFPLTVFLIFCCGIWLQVEQMWNFFKRASFIHNMFVYLCGLMSPLGVCVVHVSLLQSTSWSSRSKRLLNMTMTYSSAGHFLHQSINFFVDKVAEDKGKWPSEFPRAQDDVLKCFVLSDSRS